MERSAESWSQRGLKRPHRSYEDYTIALFLPMAVELAPLRAMLDAVHEDLPSRLDQNAYVLGELGGHNVVIASLPAIGNNDSGVVANQLRNDFPAIRFGLLVGIGGGVPGTEGKNDIRLGDVVVSEPRGTYGGVLQFDRGKQKGTNGFELTGHLNKPPQMVLATIQKLKAEHAQRGNRLNDFVEDMLRRNPSMASVYGLPKTEVDQLFATDYIHKGHDSCSGCDETKTIVRPCRTSSEPSIHYGTIGSSNAVLKNAAERDRLRAEFDILSVEMEAAGMMNTLPCLVVRGICDYADSHKNKKWQPFAAATAAAFTKELLLAVPAKDTVSILRSSTDPFVADTTSASQSFSSRHIDGDDTINEPSYQILLDSLTFARMEARVRNITDALPRTCRWIYKHRKFKAWLDHRKLSDHQGFLWIKGNPGCGKSTIMKGILNWIKRRRHDVVVTYFFNARASTDLEKSSLGLYRSISHQLLRSCPRLKHLFLDLFGSKCRNASVESWSASELKGFLIQATRLLRSQPVTLLVDALDEGDLGDIADMVSFLDDFATNACLNGSFIKVCLSSRYFPHITIRKGISLNMEDEAGHDIDVETYVRSKLVLDTSDEMQEFQSLVCHKSRGIFLWVVLVVPMLNDAYNRGRTGEMHRCLNEIPPDLEGLFLGVLATSSKNNDETKTLFTWVLFAQRPLTAMELYLAIHYTALKPTKPDSLPSASQIQRYILDVSRGLVEITRTDTQAVQFIHETVRFFLRKNLAENEDDTFHANSHATLSHACQRYHQHGLNLATMIYSTVSDSAKDLALKHHPFLEYAASYMFTHAAAAEEGGVSQSKFLKSMSTIPRHRWISTRNYFQKHRVRRYSPAASWLYIFADQGLPALVRRLIADAAKDTMTKERYGTALQAACTSGSLETVCVLVEGGSDVNAEGGECKNALLAALKHKHEGIARYLVEQGARPARKDLEAGLFTYIARGYNVGVAMMIELGVDTSNCKNGRNESALYVAATKGNIEIVQLLLAEGNTGKGHVDIKVLGRAFEKAHVAVFEVLLLHYSEGNTIMIDCHGMADDGFFRMQTVLAQHKTMRLLEVVSANQYQEELITPRPIEFDYTSSEAHDCGQRIVRYIRELERRYLMDEGRNHPHGNALHAASYHGYDQLVELLLRAGYNVNEGGESYPNALIAASWKGHDKVVTLLIKNGADLGVNDFTWGTALHVAALGGHLEVIRQLVAGGADLHTPNARNHTPLGKAIMNRQPEARKLLEELGAQR